MNTIVEKIKNTIAKTLNIKDVSNIKLNDHLKDDLGLDSMSSLIFLVNLEEAIPGFIVDPETLTTNAFDSVLAMSQYVTSQLALERREVA